MAMFSELGQYSAGGCICSESASNICCYFSHWYRNENTEMGVAPLSITLSVPPAKFSLLVLTTLGYDGLEDLVPVGRMLPPGDTIIIVD